MSRIGAMHTSVYRGETVSAYCPPPLPPNPSLNMDRLSRPLERAGAALGRLDGLSAILPNTRLFLSFYVRKEAVLSSQIEGTQSSLSDLLLFEKEQPAGVGRGDSGEVLNYVKAMMHGLERVRGGFPVCSRLLCEIHEILMKETRGSEKQPGTFRTSQNWIGGTRPGNAIYVPPPDHKVPDLLGDLDLFLNDKDQHLPVLVQTALAHVQFESIHPFLDGNGRLGRLLITLLLCVHGLMREPLLFLSLYLKENRSQYYDLLQKVRFDGAWEEWVAFFLDGVTATAENAAETAEKILQLFDEDKKKISTLKKAANSALQVYQAFQKSPLVFIPRLEDELVLSLPTIRKSIRHLQDLDIVEEITGRSRNTIYRYTQYLDILSEGTEPLAPSTLPR